jgi:hypothetical protein
MTHESRHRGPHPEDAVLFCDSQIQQIRKALIDYVWLLDRGYVNPSALKLVGDRFKLTDRQRLLLMRTACTAKQRELRQSKQLTEADVQGSDLFLDGFNVLITIESALSGGHIFVSVDGCYRDMSSIHGTYKRVHESSQAIELIGSALHRIQPRSVTWYLDRPVSNSGRLRETLFEIAAQQGWQWQVELCNDPDRVLKEIDGVVATTDSVILDEADQWLHLNQAVIQTFVDSVQLIDLRI